MKLKKLMKHLEPDTLLDLYFNDGSLESFINTQIPRIYHNFYISSISTCEGQVLMVNLRREK